MIYSLLLIPMALYIAVLIFLDSFALVKTARLILSIIYGAIACFIALHTIIGLENVCVDLTSKYSTAAIIGNFIGDFKINPIIEECFKGILLLLLIARKKVAFFIDAAIYGAAIGGGFALLDNLMYAFYNPEITIGAALLRGICTSLMQMGLTAIVGLTLMILVEMKNQYYSAYFWFPVALIPSVIMHYTFNHYTESVSATIIISIIVIPIIFILLFHYGENSIHRWLDISTNSDVQLLKAIRKGEFSTTESGEYLLSIKEHFKAAKLLDMYCYITIFLELSLVFKRNIMLEEMGMSIPNDKEVKEKITEFFALQKLIGKVGVIALSPIINSRNTNNNIMDAIKRYS